MNQWLEILESLTSGGEIKRLLSSTYPGCAGGPPKRVAVVGAATIGMNLIKELTSVGVAVVGVFDDEPKIQGLRTCGFTVRSTQSLVELDREVILIMATHRFLYLKRRLTNMGFVNVWPFCLLNLQWPKLFAVHSFYERLHENLFLNRDSIRHLACHLEDILSQKVLDAIIGFRLTLDPELLVPCLSPSAYLAPDILEFSERETMVDGGAFDGDTIRNFLRKINNHFRSVVCFEPSQGSFSELLNRFGNCPGIRCVRACVYDRNGTVIFNDTNQRDAAVIHSKEGGMVCPSLCIDGLPEAPHVTFIKLNVEGAEAKALLGAAKTLERNTPRLAVAAYHRPNDIWQIPLLIKSIVPRYRLFLRQHDIGIIETVIYAVPA